MRNALSFAMAVSLALCLSRPALAQEPLGCELAFKRQIKRAKKLGAAQVAGGSVGFVGGGLLAAPVASAGWVLPGLALCGLAIVSTEIIWLGLDTIGSVRDIKALRELFRQAHDGTGTLLAQYVWQLRHEMGKELHYKEVAAVIARLDDEKALCPDDWLVPVERMNELVIDELEK